MYSLTPLCVLMHCVVLAASPRVHIYSSIKVTRCIDERRIDLD